MAGQGADLFALGMSMTLIGAGLDLGGGPSKLQQEGRLLEQEPDRGIQTRFGQKR